MKIMHVETGRHLYGGALQVFYLLRGLHEHGFENLLVCPAGSAIAQEAAPFATIRELPMRGELDFTFGYRLWRLTRREGADILHIHSRRGADLWGGISCRITGQKAILTRRVDNPEPEWLVSWRYEPFAKIIAISEGIREVLLREGLDTEKVQCVHSAVDYDAWQIPRNRQWLSEEFDIDLDQKVVGVIAQLIERKGHSYLIAAMPQIIAKVPDVRFLFLGQGPMETQLKQKCAEAGIGHVVHFPGFRKDLPRILPNLDLVVHPALMEGLGVSLLQAAAAGIPILAGRAGGIPEIVRDGVNGYLLDPRDVSKLATLICELLQDRDKSKALGEKGRKIAFEEFSIQKMVSENIKVYEAVMNR